MKNFEYLGVTQSITLMDNKQDGKDNKLLFEGVLQYGQNYDLPEDHLLIKNWIKAGWLIETKQNSSAQNPSAKTSMKAKNEDKEAV